MLPYNKKSPSAKAAYGGIYTALTVLFLYMSAVLNLFDVAFYILASVMIGICIRETGVKLSAVVYAASSALSFAVIPNIFAALAFCLFFGIIPFVYYAYDTKLHFKFKRLAIVAFDILYGAAVYFAILKFNKSYFADIKFPYFVLTAFFIVYHPAYVRITDCIYRIFKRGVK